MSNRLYKFSNACRQQVAKLHKNWKLQIKDNDKNGELKLRQGKGCENDGNKRQQIEIIEAEWKAIIKT